MTTDNPSRFFVKGQPQERHPAERRESYLQEVDRVLASAAMALGHVSQLQEWRNGRRAFEAIVELVQDLTPARELVGRMTPQEFVQWQDAGCPDTWPPA